ncbi:hypothetical protein HpBT088_14190 [Helicobacter pylori]
MNFKKGDYSLFTTQMHGKYREKKIIFFAIMKPLSGALKTPIKTQKGAYYHGKQKHSSE